MTRTRSRWTQAALAACLLTATACSAAGAAAGRPAPATPAVDRALHDSLPRELLQRGELRVVTEATYAPASAYAADGRSIVGFEPDLGAALGQVLGLRVTFTNHPFGELIGLVGSGQADLVMSSMTDTAEREQKLDFVDYFSAGTSLLVQRGNPAGLSALGDLCGHRVAVQDGTVQVALLDRLQAHCSAPVAVTLAPDNDEALLELRTGRAEAVLSDYPPAAALTTDPRTGSHFQLASTVQYEPGLYGIGVDRQQAALRDAVRGALRELIAGGRYGEVLARWNVAAGAVREASVNAGGVGDRP